MDAALPQDALLQSLFQLLPAGVLVLDAEQRLQLANPAAAAAWTAELATGVRVELPRGTRWSSGAEVLLSQWAAVRALREATPSLGQGLWMVRADGGHRYVVHSAVPVQGKSRPAGVVVLLQDLTDLKALEVRHAAVLASMGEGLLCMDGALRITLVNRAAEALLGLSADKLVGADVDVVLEPRDRARVRSALESALSPGAPIPVTGAFRRAGGEPLEVEATASAMAWDGQVLRTLVLRDVVERVRVDAARRLLAEAGELLSSTLDERGLSLDVVRLVTRLGHADCAVLDAFRSDGSAERLAAACAPDFDAGLSHALAAQPATGDGLIRGPGPVQEAGPRLYALAGADAPLAVVPLAAVRRLLEHAGIRSALRLPLRARGRTRGTLTLLSARRTYDARDLELGSLLATRVGLALDNAGLFEAAQAAARERKTLLGVVAHELRTPISTLKLAASLVTRALPDHPEQALRAARNAERASARADGIIRDLLDGERLDAGRLAVTPVPLDMATLVPEIRALGEGLADGAHLELEVPPRLPRLRADPGRLLQVLGNLVSNAFRHAPEGSTVKLKVRPLDHGVEFRVEDAGPGVPAELLPRLFQRGACGEGERGGNGLGLFLSRQLVETMGGRIWAERSPGGGAVFAFTLPSDGPTA